MSKNYRVYVNGRLLADNIYAAFRFGQRLRGLLGRPALGENAGLWLNPGSSVHTFGMRFPIDVIFLDEGRRILNTCSNLEPNRTCLASRGTRSTLELWAGACRHRGIERGQQLHFEVDDDD